LLPPYWDSDREHLLLSNSDCGLGI
jgi:hypothetical protein